MAPASLCPKSRARQQEAPGAKTTISRGQYQQKYQHFSDAGRQPLSSHPSRPSQFYSAPMEHRAGCGAFSPNMAASLPGQPLSTPGARVTHGMAMNIPLARSRITSDRPEKRAAQTAGLRFNRTIQVTPKCYVVGAAPLSHSLRSERLCNFPVCILDNIPHDIFAH